MTATDELRRMLDERGVEYTDRDMFGKHVLHWGAPLHGAMFTDAGEWTELVVENATPEQAIAATLGREPWVNPTWERWHKSLKHDEIKSIGDAVEQLMYEAIEFGGDMGPNDNTYNGIDEGDVLTSGFINEWIERFESTLGRDRYSYKQWREIADAVGDAMEYAHNKAIECPDKADPLWNLDEYVSRILKAAFEGEATLGDGDATGERQGDAGTCYDANVGGYFVCSECDALVKLHSIGMSYVDEWGKRWYATSNEHDLHFCPNCGRRIVEVDDDQ